MEININEVSVNQLKKWLAALGLPTKGSKAELIARINAVPPNDRGSVPEVEQVEQEDDQNSNESSLTGQLQIQQAEIAKGAEMLKQLNLQIKVAKDALKNFCAPTASGISRQQLEQDDNSASDAESTDDAREEAEFDERASDARNHVAEANGEIASAVMHTQHVDKNEWASSMFQLAKEFLSEYTGETSVHNWMAQLDSVAQLYQLSDIQRKLLCMAKFKGNALNWLHTDPKRIAMPLNELLDQFVEAFGVKMSKAEMRRKYEARIWDAKEKFAAYFECKSQLAHDINLDEDELIDGIIEGIPDEALRTQARIQCFDNPRKMLRAFAEVSLLQKSVSGPKKSGSVKSSLSSSVPKESRCFNCNYKGHWAKDCLKPKRVAGSCYGCGANDHLVAQCPQRKHIGGNNYVRLININFNDKFKNSIIAECLIDSGSPISFIKKSCVPLGVELQTHFENYFGLNESQLKVLGKTYVNILKNSIKLHFWLIVVTDQSMRHEVILGRDFMKICDLNFDPSALEMISYKCNENSIIKQNISIVPENLDASHDKWLDKRLLDDKLLGNGVLKSKLLENISLGNETMKVKALDNILLEELVEPVEKINHCIFEDDFEKDMLHINMLDEGKAEDTYNIGEHIRYDVREKFVRLLRDTYINAARPAEPKNICNMSITIEKTKPFSCSPRRLSYSEKEKLQQMLDEYLRDGIIQPSSSEFASPIVLVKKKTGDLRMCIDFRKLNKIMVKDNYPLPLIDDLLDRLVGKSVFTKLDLKNGYFHVFVEKESVKYTSFVTPLGQFEFLRMPMGLKTASQVFQRFINSIFADLIKENKVIVYMDDIMIASKNLSQHVEVLEVVFKRLVENKLELRLDKCEFLQDKVKYLGFLIGKDGIKADEKGLEAVKHFPVPDKTQAVQSFLGLCSYFRRFIKDFSTIAKPLYDLLRKDKKFQFEEKELNCFLCLKEKLLEAPVLSLYNHKDDVELHCDASALGFGAVLLQKKEDGKLHPIFYFSKRTTETEAKYHSFELETLAIIYALRRFRIYLQGRKFKIVTDCNSLTLTLNKIDLNPRIARWALEMQEYDYELVHRAGKQMQHVDALSRCNNNIMIVEPNSFETNLIICQTKDKKLQEIRKTLEEKEHKLFEMQNGVIFRKTNDGRLLFYVPDRMEEHVLYKYHDELGHVGRDKMLDAINKTYWFPNLKKKVLEHIENCLKCIAFSPNSGKKEGFLHSIPKGNKPFQIIHIDHYGPVDKCRANKYIFAVVDGFTKFVRLYTTKTTNTKEVIKVLKDYFRSYSKPEYVISDRGSCFTSADFDQFTEEAKFKHIKIATGSPQANGQVERINRSLGPMIAKLTDVENGHHWDVIVEEVEYALNNTQHRSTKQFPSEMLFGIAQNGKISDSLAKQLEEITQPNKERNLEGIRENAQSNQLLSQESNEKYFNKKRKVANEYNPGDYVMVKNFDSTAGVARKLIPKSKGPYVIEKVLKNDRYLIKDIDGFQLSRNPYQGVWSANNIRHWVKDT